MLRRSQSSAFAMSLEDHQNCVERNYALRASSCTSHRVCPWPHFIFNITSDNASELFGSKHHKRQSLRYISGSTQAPLREFELGVRMKNLENHDFYSQSRMPNSTNAHHHSTTTPATSALTRRSGGPLTRRKMLDSRQKPLRQGQLSMLVFTVACEHHLSYPLPSPRPRYFATALER